MGRGDEQMFDKILFLEPGCCLALAPPALGSIGVEWLRLCITGMGQHHHDVFLGNHVFHIQVEMILQNLGTTFITK